MRTTRPDRISFQLVSPYLPPTLSDVLQLPIHHAAPTVGSQAFSLKNLDALAELGLDARHHHLSSQHTLMGNVRLGFSMQLRYRALKSGCACPSEARRPTGGLTQLHQENDMHMNTHMSMQVMGE